MRGCENERWKVPWLARNCEDLLERVGKKREEADSQTGIMKDGAKAGCSMQTGGGKKAARKRESSRKRTNQANKR